MRQRTLENRVRRTTDARELVQLQMKLDAQQGQAAVLEAATERFRYQAPNLAQFSKAGLTILDFDRLGARHVIERSRLAAEIEKVKLGASVPVPDLTPRQIARLHDQGAAEAPAPKKAKPKATAKAAAKPSRARATKAAPAHKRAPHKRSHHRKDDD
jgi:hypothetical protein